MQRILILDTGVDFKHIMNNAGIWINDNFGLETLRKLVDIMCPNPVIVKSYCDIFTHEIYTQQGVQGTDTLYSIALTIFFTLENFKVLSPFNTFELLKLNSDSVVLKVNIADESIYV